jgi:histone deacetylase complex regulatory component SIN3
MSEATEGVDQTSMRFPYLRRNIPPQSVTLENTIAEIYANLGHFDNQTAFVSPDTYKLLLSHEYMFWRTDAKEPKKYDMSDDVRNRKVEESEPFREKFVRNTKWMRDQEQEVVAARKAAWEKAVDEGDFGGFEEGAN